MPRTRAIAAPAAVTCLALGLAACASSSAGTDTSSAPAGGSAHAATVTITAADGCRADQTSFAAGGITFRVENKDATAVSEVELLSGERILAEKENIAAGLSGSFAVKVGAGRYTLYCPGTPVEKTSITVTGAAEPVDNTLAGLLKTATAQYKSYVDQQVAALQTSVATLNTALHGTDLAAAQRAYELARPYYEKIEPVAESFQTATQNLDADIDARADTVPAAQWAGFHRIEKGLFQLKSLRGLGALGDRLVRDCRTLQTKAKQLSYTAPDLANGAQGLLDEVAAHKITGEEERYSHIDLLDMANNVEGAEQAFADLRPALAEIDASLARTIAGRFAAVDTVLNHHRAPHTAANSSGYVLYSTLTDADVRELAAAVKAVQEPLSQVAAKVANA
jgi:iron uptake system component EfeO